MATQAVDVKFLNLIIVITIVLLTLEEIQARSLLRSDNNSHHRRKISSDQVNQIVRHSTSINYSRPSESSAHQHHTLNQLIDIDERSNSEHFRRHKLKKRHDHDSGIKYELMDSNIKKALQSRRYQRHERVEAKVKDVENSSSCNYTVKPFTISDNSDDYIVPKDLVDITCNYSGSTCQINDTKYLFYCCIQTYTDIQVPMKKGGHKLMRLNTGCVCAQRSPKILKQSQIINSDYDE